MVQTYSYDSFGNITPTGTINQPYAYTGREYDNETGMYFYRARYYDPKAGRFVTKDPIGFAGGDVNFYAYVGNNPLNLIDPFGLIGHEGFINLISKMANKSLEQTIKTLNKLIEKHEKALVDECQKEARKHHEHELKVFREQLELAEKEAAKIGIALGAGTTGFSEDISEEDAVKRTSSGFDWIDPFLLPRMAY